MTESGNVSGIGPAPGDSPGWGESLSREIGDLARAAETLTAAWNRRFGIEVFQNPPFVKAFLGQVRGHSILGVFKAVYARDHGSEEPSTGSFEDRFERTAEGVGGAVPVSNPVPLSPLDYLRRLVEQAQAQKKDGFLVDPQPLQRILTFVSQLKDLPALSGFRMDQLNQFPSRDVEAPPEEASSEETPVLRELPEGYRIGKVQVVRRLGVGGFAQVYLVFHAGLREHWAAKLFTKRDLLGELPTLLKAFYAEAQLQVRLKSPHIVRVIDVEEHEGYLVLFMEYVDGRNLRSLIEERKKAKAHLTPLEILRISIEGAKALEHAHSLGIVHRDMKPENILIAQDGSVKTTDFGLAKALDSTGQRRTTQLGHLLGTPQYMAPEQILGGPYDHRVDLYSLGVVIYHMAWGQPPFIGGPWELLDMQKSKKPVPLTHRMKGFPEELNRIVLKLLEKKPDNRYLSATELIKDLESCRASLSSPVPLSGRRSPRRIVAGVLVLLVLAAISGFGALKTWLHPGRNSEPAVVLGKDPITLSKAKEGPESALKDSLLPTVEPSFKHEEAKTSLAPGKAPADRASRDPNIKAPEPTPNKPEATPPAPLPAPGLREKLSLQPAGPRAAALMGELLGLFERRAGDLHAASYDGLLGDLDTFEKERLHGGGAESVSSDEGYAASHSKAARRMLELARQAVRARLERLRTSNGSVVLKTAGGGTVSGKVQDLDETKISLRNDQGGTITVELSKLALEEFVPGAGAPAAELAFGGLTLHPARTLGQVLDFEENDESVLLWVPLLVRLARLEVRGQARDTALEAKDLLPKTQAVDDQVAVLVHHVAFEAAESGLLKEKPRVLPVYGYLDSDFALAQREKEALELLLHRRYSQVIASYRDTASGPVACGLLLSGFEKALEAGSEELFAGSGWWNNQWDIWPGEPDIKKRQKLFDTRDPKAIVLRDPAGPRSMIMNDNATRAPEGILLRLSFEPEPGRSETAYWSFLLRGGKGRTDNLILRVDAAGIGLYRPILEPGAKDVCLARSPLPPATGEDPFRAYALVPGEEHLHVFVDRDCVLSLPVENARIPNQLSFTVCYGQGTVRCMLARKPLPAAAGDGKKKKETDK